MKYNNNRYLATEAAAGIGILGGGAATIAWIVTFIAFVTGGVVASGWLITLTMISLLVYPHLAGFFTSIDFHFGNIEVETNDYPYRKSVSTAEIVRKYNSLSKPERLEIGLTTEKILKMDAEAKGTLWASLNKVEKAKQARAKADARLDSRHGEAVRTLNEIAKREQQEAELLNKTYKQLQQQGVYE